MLNEMQRREYARLRRNAVQCDRAPADHRHPAYVPLYPAFEGRGRKYPEAGTARACLAAARRFYGKVYTSESIWTRPLHVGAPSTDYGATALQWIEDPEAVGLRFIGLAHKVYPRGIDHLGWFLDSEYESVAGVVYQLPTRKGGRERYVAGWADPHNSDSEGRGPACLDLGEIFEADPVAECNRWRRDIGSAVRLSEFTEAAAEQARHDAARHGDRLAERMAKEEREYQDTFRAGAEAREKAAEALAVGKRYVAALRRIGMAFCSRRIVPAEGKVSAAEWRAGIRSEVAEARLIREEWCDALHAARRARRDKPASYLGGNLLDAWETGYREGV